ncbi:histidine kinase [Stutzerimonas xanthomarina]|uniref:ANTAR domain-containing response regulator n=1 Tax=Stutzerimonas nitrititolerans TaxID=2482751 RepID=UPI00082484C5|nr:ANTAR domain-containing protein [Stutzerimonas nitrititolerans]OCX20098.1 histidine kinase [Stutzerimonas xanthomarina]
MLRTFLIDDMPANAGHLRSALVEAGFEVIEQAGSYPDLAEQIETARPQVILIESDSPSRSTLATLDRLSRGQPRPIVLFTDDDAPEAMRRALQAGVSGYIVEGIQAHRLKPILEVAMERFKQDSALRADLQARVQQLAERKRIELAKGILMKMRDCQEQEAYALMRRQAMSRQQKLIQVAEQIITMNDLLAG